MKKFILIVSLLLYACTPITLVVPKDPELPKVTFIFEDLPNEAVACVSENGLKTLYNRELILQEHIKVLKEQIKRCND